MAQTHEASRVNPLQIDLACVRPPWACCLLFSQQAAAQLSAAANKEPSTSVGNQNAHANCPSSNHCHRGQEFRTPVRCGAKQPCDWSRKKSPGTAIRPIEGLFHCGMTTG